MSLVIAEHTHKANFSIWWQDMLEGVIRIGSIAGISGLVVGLMYIIGGLIVSIHLSRYGVVRYNILREKSLAVGGNYLFGVFIIYQASRLITPFVARHNIFRNTMAILLALTVSAITLSRFSYRSRKFLERKYFVSAILFVLTTSVLSLFVNVCGDWRYSCNISKEFLYILMFLGFYSITLFYAELVYPYPVFLSNSGPELLFTGLLQEVRIIVDPQLVERIEHIAVDLSQPVILLDQSSDGYSILLKKDGLVVTLRKDVVDAVIYSRALKHTSSEQ